MQTEIKHRLRLQAFRYQIHVCSMYEIPVYPTESFEHAQKPDTTRLSVISNFELNSLAEVPGEERPILNFKIKPKI